MQSKNKNVGFPFADNSSSTRYSKYCKIARHLRRNCGRQIFPIRETSEEFNKSQKETEGERSRIRIANTLTARSGKDGSENLIARTFNRKEGLKDELYIAHSLQSSDIGLNQNQNQNCIVHSLQPRSPDRPSLKYSSGGSGHLTRKDNKTYCLDSRNSQAAELTSEKSRIRRLTPIECERLQGFPDNFTEGVSNSQRYKMLGNAVTVNVISEIAKGIKNKYH